MTCFDEKRRLFVLGATTLVVGCFGAQSGDDSTNDDAGDEDGGDESTSGDCTQTAGTYVGDVTSFAQGTWTLTGQIIVAQDVDGLYAYTAICTHAGCVVDAPASNGRTLCPCHGSQFDGNGAVLRGPAASPLRHFAVALCDGGVYVDTTTTVSATARTPPS